jgi:histidine triad (HIT) family protein
MDNFIQKLKKRFIGVVFFKASFLIPQKKLRETDNWVVYVHPRPSYPVHLVILPKQPISDWLAIPVHQGELFSELIILTQGMIREFCLEETGYRLITNGGKYQTFPHLHFHLVAGEAGKN